MNAKATPIRIVTSAVIVIVLTLTTASASEATYHSFSNSNSVSRINGDGEVNFSFPLPGLGSFTQPTGIAIDPVAKKLYYTRVNFIGSVNLDGTGNTTVRELGLNNGPTHLEIDVENGHLYFYIDSTAGMGRGIFRMNTDGTDLIPIITAATLAAIDPPIDPLIDEKGEDGMVIDTTGNALYWSDDRRVYSATLAGKSPIVLSTLPFNIADFDIHHPTGKLYYSNSTTIQRSNLDGSSVETVYDPGFGFPEALEIDADRERLYFFHASAVRYTNLDGSLAPVEVRTAGSFGRARDIEVGSLPALTDPKITRVESVVIGNKLRFKITHTTDPGIQYRIDSSGDMRAGTWASTGITVVGDGTEMASDFPFDAARKFFRVVRLDPCE